MFIKMSNIHIKPETKKLLDEAIKFFVKEKGLPEDYNNKFSYDFIIKELLDYAGEMK